MRVKNAGKAKKRLRNLWKRQYIYDLCVLSPLNFTNIWCQLLQSLTHIFQCHTIANVQHVIILYFMTQSTGLILCNLPPRQQRKPTLDVVSIKQNHHTLVQLTKSPALTEEDTMISGKKSTQQEWFFQNQVIKRLQDLATKLSLNRKINEKGCIEN